MVLELLLSSTGLQRTKKTTTKNIMFLIDTNAIRRQMATANNAEKNNTDPMAEQESSTEVDSSRIRRWGFLRYEHGHREKSDSIDENNDDGHGK